MWIADMDFHSPRPVIDAAILCASHGMYGYTNAPAQLADLILQRLGQQYGCSIAEHDWLTWLPGLVPGLSHAVKACCRLDTVVGDAVVVTPTYHKIRSLPALHGVRAIPVPLVAEVEAWPGAPVEAGACERDQARVEEEVWADEPCGRQSGTAGVVTYCLDWALLEAKLARPSTSLLLLCNPHNPSGRCFSVRSAWLGGSCIYGCTRGCIHRYIHGYIHRYIHRFMLRSSSFAPARFPTLALLHPPLLALSLDLVFSFACSLARTRSPSLLSSLDRVSRPHSVPSLGASPSSVLPMTSSFALMRCGVSYRYSHTRTRSPPCSHYYLAPMLTRERASLVCARDS